MDVPGLIYRPEYISQPHHDWLLATIDAQPWRGDLSRRTQHYGYVYDYRARKVEAAMWLGALPAWLQRVATHLWQDGLAPHVPDQAIINEYLPGQGIADHIDCTPCFGDVIVSLSLACGVVMDLKCGEQVEPIWLEPRSVLVLTGESRSRWTHGIAKRKQDTVNGVSIERGRRVSVTFRKVVLETH